jgi:hypothetical protein
MAHFYGLNSSLRSHMRSKMERKSGGVRFFQWELYHNANYRVTSRLTVTKDATPGAVA